ncbi:MAG: phosphotransferase family protein [Deltaproteobacteria bacterium]|nr:phosphotransferase family protein [Deltaproteobacteria bacterium]
MAEADGAIAPETIPIRADEDFDHARLAEYLRGRLPGADGAPRIVQFGGGHANLTYLLTYGAQEFVLRRPPLGPVAPGAHDMGREYRVLSVLYAAYPLAPRAFLFCDDPAVLGAPFFVMERRRGTVVRQQIPPEFGGGADTTANRRMSEALIDALADLHQVEPQRVGLQALGRPEGFLRRQVDGWAQRYERARTGELPLVAVLVDWLRAEMPASPPATLLHNDWRLDNIMLASDDPGRCVAVFDWDMCTLGDPLADLGTLLAAWRQAGEDVGAMTAGTMPSHVPGFLTRAEAVARYAARRGIDAATVPYYYVFGLFKVAVVLQQIYHRYHVGQTRDARFAHFDGVVAALLERADARRRSLTL